jgi:hypothetical protein
MQTREQKLLKLKQYFCVLMSSCFNARNNFFRRAPQQMLRTHRSLKTYCATLVMKTKRKIISFFHCSKSWSTSGMKLTGENRCRRGKTGPSATLSTTNPTWADPGSNPGLRGGRPATNRQNTILLLPASPSITEGPLERPHLQLDPVVALVVEELLN